MVRILAYTTPDPGNLFPLTPILDELRRRGHRIALRTLASQLPSLQGHGFDAAPISDRIEAIQHDDWRASNPRAALARAVGTFTQRADHDAPDLARAIDQQRPDALLVDVNAWGALAAAEAWAGPWATFCPYQDDGRLVQAALEALAEEPVAVVATLPAGDPARVPAPANARVERFIPHRPVLDRAACAVTHGGMAPPRRPSPAACRSVSSRSGATNWRSRGGWR